jgi:hypothetical protein
MCHEEMHHQMQICRRLLVLQGMFGPSTSFCNWNFRTPAWVNNVIGLHESCLGQLPWDRFTGEFLSPRVFYPQVINWAFQPY